MLSRIFFFYDVIFKELLLSIRLYIFVGTPSTPEKIPRQTTEHFAIPTKPLYHPEPWAYDEFQVDCKKEKRNHIPSNKKCGSHTVHCCVQRFQKYIFWFEVKTEYIHIFWNRIFGGNRYGKINPKPKSTIIKIQNN